VPRGSYTEYHRFPEIAFASLKEVHYQSELAFRSGNINEKYSIEYNLKITETEKVLGALIRSMK